jgi:hypothetical protein
MALYASIIYSSKTNGSVHVYDRMIVGSLMSSHNLYVKKKGQWLVWN